MDNTINNTQNIIIDEKSQLVFQIAQMEWEMFQNVYNTGGRASCQDDPDTFFKMRMSQWLVYSRQLLESYADDIKKAHKEGGNLYFEKYARMMETTYAAEYDKLKQYLPAVSKEKAQMAEEAVQIHLAWDKEVAEKYPNLRGLGRVMTTAQDGVMEGSSMESYLRSELLTLSEKTLALLLAETKAAYAAGGNLVKDIIENETRFYGYATIDDAEARA